MIYDETMKTINNYIYCLFELNKRQTLNAPEFAYYTLFGKEPKGGIYGREGSHPKKKIQGIDIDKEIPTKAIRELIRINEIEMRSSCQGSSKERPSFIIFRPVNQDKSYVKKLVKCLNKEKNIKCDYNIGKGNWFRICVTWNTWAGEKGNEKWWLSLPGKIKSCI